MDGAPVTDPRNPDVKVWLTLNSMVLVPGTPPRLHEVQDVPHGAVVMHTYRSKSLGQTRQLYVYTPPGYTAKSKPLPVVYLKHGFGDGPSAWTAVGQAHVIADNLIAQHAIEPMLIVMPWGHVISPRLARSRAEHGAQRRGRRARAARRHHSVHRSTYRRGEVRGPARDRRPLDGRWPVADDRTVAPRHVPLDRRLQLRAAEGDLEKAFPHLKADAAKKIGLLWVGIGKKDFLLERNEKFNAWLTDQQIKHTWVLSEGGHEWPVVAKVSRRVPPAHLQSQASGFRLFGFGLLGSRASRRKRP